ncbi:MAG: aminoglycoside phosphotransferase family protein [Actinobacteria bacterium]|nr:aminoglycoside phosphotransferase family protein [Actinomycetota bacterium]
MDRLHRDEVPISRALAARLLSEQHPDLARLPLSLLEAQGTDNVVFRLGDDLALRLPRTASAVPGLLVELDWVPRLAPELPLPVPVPIARGEPTEGYPFPWSVCRWVDGRPADPTRLRPDQLAQRLGGFVGRLQSIDTTGAPVADDGTRRAGSLTTFDDETRGAIAEVTALMSARRIESDLFDPARARDLWEAALGTPAWPGDGVWVHRDLHADNLVMADGMLVGVLDLGGLIVGDPAGDVMAAWHLLQPPHRATFLRIVEADEATQLRARGWVLSQGLLALPYYLDSHAGMRRMACRAIRAALDPPV